MIQSIQHIVEEEGDLLVCESLLSFLAPCELFSQVFLWVRQVHSEFVNLLALGIFFLVKFECQWAHIEQVWVLDPIVDETYHFLDIFEIVISFEASQVEGFSLRVLEKSRWPESPVDILLHLKQIEFLLLVICLGLLGVVFRLHLKFKFLIGN